MENLFSKFIYLSPDTHRDFYYEKNHLLSLKLGLYVNILSFIVIKLHNSLMLYLANRDGD
jgi:hypothetical protein